MGRAKKSIMKKQTECQYAQLMFDPPSSTSNSRTFASDDSVLYVNPSPQHRRHNQTNYATIGKKAVLWLEVYAGLSEVGLGRPGREFHMQVYMY